MTVRAVFALMMIMLLAPAGAVGAAVSAAPELGRMLAADRAAPLALEWPGLAAAGSAGAAPGRAARATEAGDPGAGSPEGRRRISPLRAFVYSAVLPGWGQLAQGSRTGYAYLATEAVSWTGWVVYRRRGQRGEDRYEEFARQNYVRAQYDSVVAEIYREFQGGICQTSEGDSLYDCQALGSYFNLDPLPWTGHALEDVGKLDKYIFGWRDWGDTDGDGVSDYDPVINAVDFSAWAPGEPWPTGFPPLVSALRAQYQDLRRAANRDFDRSTNFSWLLLLNRVGSAFHAAYLARRAAVEGERSGFDLEVAPAGDGFRLAVARGF